MDEKQEIRKQALQVRNALSKEQRKQQSAEIVEQIRLSELYRKSQIVLSYAAFRSEVETEALNQQILEDGKQLYLPKTDGKAKKMSFFHVTDLAELTYGYQGILEPQETEEPAWRPEKDYYDKADVLVLMPGVAFDEAGNRMGYGGGYYDRFLARYGDKMVSVLLAYEEQKLQQLPTDIYDIRPEYIVTQKKWRKQNK